VELDGGRVVHSEAVGLAELEHRLWTITRDRRLSIEPDRSSTCQTCGAARVGNFRWCKSCGSDFESQRRSERPSIEDARPAVPAMAEPATAVRRTASRDERVTQSPTVIAPHGPDPAHHSSPARSQAAPAVWLLTAPDDDLDLVKPFPAARPLGASTPRARPIPPPVPSSRISRWIEDFSDQWLAPQRLWLGALIGLAIGVIMTIVLLAID
jgi:hypothetical protein